MIGAFWWDGSSWTQPYEHYVWDGFDWQLVNELYVWDGTEYKLFWEYVLEEVTTTTTEEEEVTTTTTEEEEEVTTTTTEEEEITTTTTQIFGDTYEAFVSSGTCTLYFNNKFDIPDSITLTTEPQFLCVSSSFANFSDDCETFLSLELVTQGDC
jgi:hypothetical protein